MEIRKMLVALVGVTGVGKSFFKNLIIQELGFKNLPIVTTRQKREGEIDGIDKEFVTDEEFEKMKQSGITQVNFELAGAKYGYRKEYLLSTENRVTEVHYRTIYEFKKCAKDLFSIYMIPYDLERAKLELQKRNLPPQILEQRLEEIDKHIREYTNNLDLREQFDYVLVNDYTEKSNQKVIEIVKDKMKKGIANE